MYLGFGLSFLDHSDVSVNGYDWADFTAALRKDFEQG